MEYRHLLAKVQGHVFVIILDRDEARNAVNRRLERELRHAMERFEADESLWVAVLGHKGDCFCAGADLKEMLDPATERDCGAEPPARAEAESAAADWGFASLTGHVFSKPVIAAVDGKALGGGMEIVLALDLAVASKSSVFGLPEVRRGLMAAGGGGILNLTRRVPFKAALELIYTGQPISADRAYELGLINQVTPDGEAMAAALDLAERICASAPAAVRYSKAIAYECMDAPAYFPPTAWEINLRYKALNDATEDAAEGVRAFAEKRAPVWKNR